MRNAESPTRAYESTNVRRYVLNLGMRAGTGGPRAGSRDVERERTKVPPYCGMRSAECGITNKNVRMYEGTKVRENAERTGNPRGYEGEPWCGFRAGMAIQRPRRIRKRSSIAVKVVPGTIPQRRDSRSLATERISSHLIKLLTFTPPSGGFSST